MKAVKHALLRGRSRGKEGMRILAFFLFFIVLASIALYLCSGTILSIISEKAIDYITANIRVPKLSYLRPSFKSVKLTAYNTVTWYGVVLNVTMMRDEINNRTESVVAEAEELSVILGSLADRTVSVNIKGFNAERKDWMKSSSDFYHEPGDWIEAGDLRFQVRFKAIRPYYILEQIRGILAELKRFSRSGITKIPIQFTATETFSLKGKPYKVKVRVMQDGDEYRLVMDEDVLRKIGNLGGAIPPTSGDIKVIARNPLKAPQLMRIRDRAETTAKLAHKTNPNIPEDAYRHTLWAYLLTRAYGEKFAKEVLDAHESGADEEELKHAGGKPFKVASYQDLNNNAVGRRYALMGYTESDVLSGVLNDPAIIRDNEAVNRYNPGEMERYKSSIHK